MLPMTLWVPNNNGNLKLTLAPLLLSG